MKSYIEKPVNIQADQWDGTKENMLKLINDFAINHNEVAYDNPNGTGKVATWRIGNLANQTFLVATTDFIVSDSKGNLQVLKQTAFEKLYVLKE